MLTGRETGRTSKCCDGQLKSERRALGGRIQKGMVAWQRIRRFSYKLLCDSLLLLPFDYFLTITDKK